MTRLATLAARLSFKCGAALALLAPLAAQAHPQHAGGHPLGAGLAHLLSEPDHLALLLAPVVVAGVWAWRSRVLARRRAAGARVERAGDVQTPRRARSSRAT